MGDMKESRERGSRGTVFRPSVHCHDSVESCDDCLLEVDERTDGRTRTDGLSIPGKISAFAAHGSRARQSGIMHYSKRCSITHSHGEIPSFPLSSRVSLLPAPSSLPLSLFRCAALTGHIFSGPPSYCLDDLCLPPSRVRPRPSFRLSIRSSARSLARWAILSLPPPPLPLPLSPDERAAERASGRASERASRAWEIHQIARMSKRSVRVRPRVRASLSTLALFTGVPFGGGRGGGDRDWPIAPVRPRCRRPWSFLFTWFAYPSQMHSIDRPLSLLSRDEVSTVERAHLPPTSLPSPVQVFCP